MVNWDNQANAMAHTFQQITPSMTQAQIQALLDNGGRFYFEPGEYLIDVSTGLGLSIASNSVIEFAPGAKLIALAASVETYAILMISEKSDVTLNHPAVIGERATHTGTAGEWGHGLQISNSRRITVNRGLFRDCWGDGIYISGASESIVLDHPICDNNRRQGISVISCNGLDIISPVLTNTNGTLPQAGIDFEPNVPENCLENIRVVNPLTKNNSGPGILIAPYNLANTDGKCIDIRIEGHRDEGSLNGMAVQPVVGTLNGMISTHEPVWINAQHAAYDGRNCSADGPRVEIHNPVVLSPNRQLLGSATRDVAFRLSREAGDVSTSPIGNLHIFRPSIVTDTNTQTLFYLFDDIAPVKNISLVDPVELPQEGIPRMLWHNVETGIIRDQYRQLVPSTQSHRSICAENENSVINTTSCGGTHG